MAIKANAPDMPPTPRKDQWPVYAAVAALLVWYFVSTTGAVADKSSAFDEVLHLTGGYSYWKFGDFRIQPENGNLPQRWAAMPLLLSDPRFPDLNQEAWKKSYMATIGHEFFYRIGNDAEDMLRRGRAMIGLFGMALGAIVFFWTRSLLGTGAALLSLGLYAFCPTMLANGALATSDMTAALFFTASIYCTWRLFHDVNWRVLLVGSLVMGGLFVSKFSAFMLAPMVVVLLAVQLISHRPTVITYRQKRWEIGPRRWRFTAHLTTLAVHAVVVWIVIWTFYNFRYEMFAMNKLQPGEAGKMLVVEPPFDPWTTLNMGPGPVDRFIDSMREARLLPEAYLYGFAVTWRSAQKRNAFLNGNYSVNGWSRFFPYCLLVKTPLTLFVLMGFAAVSVIRRWIVVGKTWQARSNAMFASLYRTAPLWTLVVVYCAFAISSHLNIGHRHILPIYPAMLMFAGGSWSWLVMTGRPTDASCRVSGRPENRAWWIPGWLAARRWPMLANIVLASMGLFVAESLWRWPNYLAYFNQLVGSPRYAYRHLVDSSLDWGQELPALKRWLVKDKPNRLPTERIYLSYFGVGSPAYYGIEATFLPSYYERTPPRIPEPLEPGTYCISATMLQNVYTKFPGRWCRQYETIYQRLTSDLRTFEIRSPVGRKQLFESKGEDYWIQLFRHYEHARLARLTSFLRQREPDFEINYSILIYRLGATELNRAVDGPPIELDESPFGDVVLNE
jgi:hypothetical protein